ncbi:MAG: hypothetical protein JO180_11490, partial [Gemmatirosa sp.]|nr:hypothetical protein [Gemmatirosa sp.]
MPALSAAPRSLARLLAAAALVLGSASALRAQISMRFDSTGSITAFRASDLAPSGADVGPSYATILGRPGMPGQNRGLIVYCVDISNDALYGQVWDAWVTPLGGTPAGTTPSLDLTRQGAIDADALVHYRKAAWLVGQYASHP